MQEHLRNTKSFVGRPPFGYVIAGEAKAKILVPDPVQADAICTVVALYLTGKSLRWLCAYLDAEGIPTRRGGSWVPKTLSEVLRNPVLAGRQVNGKGRTLLKVPPILDQDTWRKLQAEMDRKASKKGVAQAGTAMLGGVAVCAKCGGPMYRLNAYNTRKDGTKIDLFYMRCWGTSTEPSRCKNMYPLEELEARVERFMTTTLARWPRYEMVTVPGHGHEEEIYEVERDLRELDFDDPDFTAKQVALLAERARLRALPSVPAFSERRATGDTIGEHWATLKADAEKREFLQLLGMVIRVRRGKPRDEADPFSEGIPDIVSFETSTASGFLDEFLRDPPQEQGAVS